MSITITERLQLLRNQLKKRKLQACIIPTSDPHQSEYTADFWKFREYISGFTGSTGTLIVGSDKAGLWTDSRYFLQAEEELRGSGIQLLKLGIQETPSLEKWIKDQGYKAVGIDGSVFSSKETLSLYSFFKQENIVLETEFEPYKFIWPDRPGFPKGNIYIFPEKFCGESANSKLRRLRTDIINAGAECMPLSALDEIAWLFNLRGEDIDYNPIGICYAFIDKEKAILFVDSKKLKPETVSYLQKNNVSLSSYGDLSSYLKKLSNENILLDSTQINYKLYQSIQSNCTIIEKDSPIKSMKAIKNAVEISGFRKAMIKDGIALTRFWMWLEKAINTQEKSELPNEWMIGDKIAEFRHEQENYICESFCPIVGYNEHSAIVHYEATQESTVTVSPESFLLIDTGGQYLDGTTDITRSWSFYPETPAKYKEDYTSILKGVIALSSVRFPAGTRGVQLDVLARQFLWQRDLNFGHGTGHGVGHFLNVHEGPQSIRMNENPTILEVGMITSIEPGVYRSGEYGIRIENLTLICEKESSEFGKFLTFETLTLLPFDLNSIEKGLLNSDEINWIDNYHQMVYDRLTPGLNETECRWLKEKTRKINYPN
jgi:Xaa-Pro aminopeptidase